MPEILPLKHPSIASSSSLFIFIIPPPLSWDVADRSDSVDAHVSRGWGELHPDA
jgi:hypothetical protein